MAAAETDPAEVLAELGLTNVKIEIELYQNSITRHYIPRLVLNCRCGDWGVTMTLATWSNLGTVSESAMRHLASCKERLNG
jgi:hypothetical protein